MLRTILGSSLTSSGREASSSSSVMGEASVVGSAAFSESCGIEPAVPWSIRLGSVLTSVAVVLACSTGAAAGFRLKRWMKDAILTIADAMLHHSLGNFQEEIKTDAIITVDV